MRLALLSALADQTGRLGGSAGERPAFRRFAGKTVLMHQIDCAAHLGCARVLCLANGPGPDLGAAKVYAERAGLRFEVVDSLVRLTGLVTADDEVILIADGVLPDCAALVGALAQRPAVLAFPTEPALSLGFERLDATRAWSGALRTRGESVARLADLPADCDLASTLLRIALQMGAGVVEIDPAPLAEGTWQRRVDRRTAAETEWRWITRQVQPASFAAPGLALAERIGLRWAHDLGGGRWARAPHLAALVAGVLATLAGLASWPLAGLGLLLLASLALAVAGIFDRVEGIGARPRGRGWLMPAAGWLRDGLLAGLLALLIAAEPGWIRAFLPLALVGVLRLGEATGRPPLRALFGDRILLLSGLLGAAWLGWTGAAVAALTIAAIAALFAQSLAPAGRLTAD